MNKSDFIHLIQSDIQDMDTKDVSFIQDEITKIPEELISRLVTSFNTENSVENAYLQIGSEAGYGAMGIKPLKEGKRIFNNFRSELQNAICNYEPLKIYCMHNTRIEVVTVAGLVMGGLLASKTAGIDVVSASIILSRLGIKKVCAIKWSIKEDE